MKRLVGGLLVLWLPVTAGADEVVTVFNFDFSPELVTIHEGESVTWNWTSGSHSTTSDDGEWDSGIRSSGDSFTLPFHDSGSFDYHCTPHPFMTGTVDVLEGDVLTLHPPDPGVAGVSNDFVITGGEAASSHFLVFSFNQGSVAVPGCAGLTLGLGSVGILGSTVTDGAGNGSISRVIPGGAAGATIHMQAVDLDHCAVSNIVTATFQ